MPRAGCAKIRSTAADHICSRYSPGARALHGRIIFVIRSVCFRRNVPARRRFIIDSSWPRPFEFRVITIVNGHDRLSITRRDEDSRTRVIGGT